MPEVEVPDPDRMALTWAARPWADVPADDLAPAMAVTSMLNAEESRLYHWIGRQARGFGASVDLGAFAGGSAARLLSGLALSGAPYHLHAFDYFTASGKAREKFFPQAPADAAGVVDLFPIAVAHLAPWEGHVSFHRGDIRAAEWQAGAIEILLVDAAKSAASCDHIARTFFPHLVAGRSLVVHQDFLQPVTPWLPAQTQSLRHCFRPLIRVAPDCIVFLCTKTPDAADLAEAETETASDRSLIARIIDCADWLKGVTPSDRFATQIERLRLRPGKRKGYELQVKQAARSGRRP